VIALKDQLHASLSSPQDLARIKHKFDQVYERWQALIAASDSRRSQLKVAEAKYREIDDLYLLFAKKASTFNSWFENAEEDLTDPVRCNTIEEIHELIKAHERFMNTLGNAVVDFDELQQLDAKIKAAQMGPNPYTWFTIDTLRDTWRSLQKAIKDRDADLQQEQARQEENDALRQKFAQLASGFYKWLADTRAEMMEIGTCVATLESQLTATKKKSDDIRAVRVQFKVCCIARHFEFRNVESTIIKY
jgi:spectrin alpha